MDIFTDDGPALLAEAEEVVPSAPPASPPMFSRTVPQGNSFIERPEITPVIMPATWQCPITGLTVPKLLGPNLAWRRELLQRADKDIELQEDLFAACNTSLLFWVNAFGWTLNVFDTEGQSNRKHAPFITWPQQDALLLHIEQAIVEGSSLLTDKARDVGATWLHLFALAHRFLFRQDEQHLIVSRKEKAVDETSGQIPKTYPFGILSDPGTLFGKLDYLLARLPQWMVPAGLARKKLSLINPLQRTRIDGESTTGNVAVSDRRTSIFLDEFALVEEATAVKRNTADVTKCRLVCSAPYGPGSVFSEWRMSGQIAVFDLPWWSSPEKSRGLYIEKTDLGKYRIRSPWYDKEARTRSPKELASQVDRDHLGSGDLFFEPTAIERHRLIYVRPPKRRCHILLNPRLRDDEIVRALRERDLENLSLTRGIDGPWSIWSELPFREWGLRPDQHLHYVMGVDVSRGQGASNSAVAVLCIETHEKVAEFASNTIPPYEFARLVCAAALWVGGQGRLPDIIYEANGNPGWDFGRCIKRYEYPRLWVDKSIGKVTDKETKRYGFHSSTEKKAVILGALRRAYAHSLIMDHSAECLLEAERYIHYNDGGIGPALSAEASKSDRKDHGDRIIATALAYHLCPDHFVRTGREEAERIAPTNSVYARMQERFRELREEKRQQRLNAWD
jgi:hypothetical protein